jgi:hypothetical protein
MSVLDRLPYREIWAADFEFGGGDGNVPAVRCLVARELRTGRTIRVWEDELLRMREPPYPIDAGALFIAYYASAEIGCHLALNWPVPVRILDLFTEWRAATNGLDVYAVGRRLGNSLLDAMSAFGLDTMLATEKREMRELAIRGGPWSAGEPEALLDYCEADVDSLDQLIRHLLPLTLERQSGLAHALIRGRAMAALAHVEHVGLPLDVPLLARLREAWSGIIDRLIAAVDGPFGFYDGRSFRMSRFRDWLAADGRRWPLLPSGQLDLGDDTFRDMAKIYPDLMPIHELRATLSGLRLESLQVGDDGRNRVLLSAYRAVSGRNAPSNTKFIFGPATWMRGLIKPPPGHAFVYIDWSSQEIGIGAALSGDKRMMAAYASGDFYMAFAKQVGLAPPDAMSKTHGPLRDMVKAVVLGLGYGMGKASLARRLGTSEALAAELIGLYWRTYPAYEAWLEGAVHHAMLWNSIPTVFGWPMHIEGRYDPRSQSSKPNPRTLRNFPCQGNGAEMLRLAICLGVERGIRVVAPVHDAIAIETEIDRMQEDIAAMRDAMAEASRVVLGGFELRTKAEPVVYPNRYADPRGAVMWEKIMALVPDMAPTEEAHPCLKSTRLTWSAFD